MYSDVLLAYYLTRWCIARVLAHTLVRICPQTKIPGMFKGSTETVFAKALPQLIEMDGLQLPTTLGFSVPAIPKGMMQKALWYVDHKESHLWAFSFEVEEATKDTAVGGSVTGYYVLSRDNAGGFTHLLNRKGAKGTLKGEELRLYFEMAELGQEHTGVKDDKHLMDICNALHFVRPATLKYGCVPCEGNPLELICSCKGCKSYGICSHVLGLNHVLKGFNLRRELATMGKSKALKAGRPAKPAPALTREPQAAPDSSDEEEERLLQLGAEGK